MMMKEILLIGIILTMCGCASRTKVIPLTISGGNTTVINNIYNGSTGSINESFWNQTSSLLYPNDLNFKVGIGTSSPSEKLSVSGNASVTESIYVGADLVGIGGIGGWESVNPIWEVSGNVVSLVDSSNLVGIGTNNPGTKIKVSGDSNITGNIYSGGDLIAS